MRTRSNKLGRIPKLSELAGTKTITKKQWSRVVATFSAVMEKDCKRKKIRQ